MNDSLAHLIELEIKQKREEEFKIIDEEVKNNAKIYLTEPLKKYIKEQLIRYKVCYIYPDKLPEKSTLDSSIQLKIIAKLLANEGFTDVHEIPDVKNSRFRIGHLEIM